MTATAKTARPVAGLRPDDVDRTKRAFVPARSKLVGTDLNDLMTRIRRARSVEVSPEVRIDFQAPSLW